MDDGFPIAAQVVFPLPGLSNTCILALLMTMGPHMPRAGMHKTALEEWLDTQVKSSDTGYLSLLL